MPATGPAGSPTEGAETGATEAGLAMALAPAVRCGNDRTVGYAMVGEPAGLSTGGARVACAVGGVTSGCAAVGCAANWWVTGWLPALTGTVASRASAVCHCIGCTGCCTGVVRHWSVRVAAEVRPAPTGVIGSDQLGPAGSAAAGAGSTASGCRGRVASGSRPRSCGSTTVSLGRVTCATVPPSTLRRSSTRMPYREASRLDHGQTHQPERRHVHRRRGGQPAVERVQLLLAQPQATVLDLDQYVVADPPGVGDHDRVRRGEPGRVVEQLGDQPDHVVDRVRGHRDVGVDGAELDPVVGLDLGLRGAQRVHQQGVVPAWCGGVGTGEHQQVLVVAAHSGGQVVELEELGQPLRVLLAALDHVELADHAVDQRLASTGQVEEHRRDAGPQGGLLGRDPDSFPVYDVEGECHLPDLVLVGQPDRVPDLADDLLHAAVTDAADVLQPGDRVRQVVVGDREGALTQPAQRGVQGAGQHHGQRDRDDQRDQHQQ